MEIMGNYRESYYDGVYCTNGCGCKENVHQEACNSLGCLHAHLLAREPGLSFSLLKAALKAV